MTIGAGMKRTHHLFPQNPEFERKFSFKADLPFLVSTIAGLDGQFGSFVTDGPDRKATPIQAKRSIEVEIADKSVDFVPLNKNTLGPILRTLHQKEQLILKLICDIQYWIQTITVWLSKAIHIL